LNEGNPTSGVKPPPLESPPAPRGVPCHSCRAYIDPAFPHCPYCGKRQDIGGAWYYHPVWILLLAFVALGPFALPLVWKSRLMSPIAKAITAAAILVYTAFCVYAVYVIVSSMMSEFSQINDLYR